MSDDDADAEGDSDIDVEPDSDGDIDPDIDLDRELDADDDWVCMPAHECCRDMDCSNSLFCDGLEVCDHGQCMLGAPIDCTDDHECTEDTCNEASNRCVHASPDRDRDGYADAECLGNDCDDHDRDVYPDQSERCDNRVDDDCDDLVDCEDEDCAGTTTC